MSNPKFVAANIREALHTLDTNTVKMDPVVKGTWLADLRSGQIVQCHGKLMDDEDAMCCLGVLVFAQEGNRALLAGHIENLQEDSVNALFGDGYAAGIPVNVQQALAVLNDNGWTFAQIADGIEGWL